MRLLFTLTFITITIVYCHAQPYYSFSATSGNYTSLVADTILPLSVTATGTGYLSTDEGYANNIPIGFTFQYDGYDYTVIHANTNGFAGFGLPFVTDSSNFDRKYYINSLSGGVPFYPFTRSQLAPLWDDLGLVSVNGLSYKTEGAAPNRIFTLQWSQVKWNNYGGTAPHISFQIKLFETTNVVEFVYKSEGGTLIVPQASIGITTVDLGPGSFISLQNTSAAPTISSTTETTTLSIRPATGQVYRFTPDTCAPPNGLRTSAYNYNSVVFKWVKGAYSGAYQYAVDTSATPPTSGTLSTNNQVTVTGLTSKTLYYIHVKTNCGTDWRTISFTTATLFLALPFVDSFETCIEPDLPAGWRTEVIGKPTTGGYIPWTSGNDSTIATSGGHFLYATADFSHADKWAFTPTLYLQAGTIYMLKFKYGIIGSIRESLQVKIGSKTGGDSMRTTPIFENADIQNDVSVSKSNWADTTISFTVPATGAWYIGFNYNTTIEASYGGFLVLEDVSVAASTTVPISLLSFSGYPSGKNHLLTWKTATEQNNKGFEIQQSDDGINFEKIAFVSSRSETGNSTQKLSYNYLNDKLFAGKNYYRLRQIDKDGKFIYSRVIVINNLKQNLTIYPNPVQCELTAQVQSDTYEQAFVQITDMQGKVLLKHATQINIGITKLRINTSKLERGNYIPTLRGGVNRQQMFMKE